MEKTSKIYVAGHTGLVGGAVFKKLQALGYEKCHHNDEVSAGPDEPD